MTPAIRIWWTLGATAEPPAAAARAGVLSAVPSEWRKGRRGRFLEDVVRRCRDEAHWTPRGAARGWRFNLSAGRHLSLTDTGAYLIVAVGQGVPIGIDAERIRPVEDKSSTLRRLGLDRLAAGLSRLDPAARNLAFIHVWTAFEALLKLERLPWAAAAARFAAVQDRWYFATDGTASFVDQGRTGLAFGSVRAIPGLVLTVAAPFSCPPQVTSWRDCGAGVMAGGKRMAGRGGELRPRGKETRIDDYCAYRGKS
ncbi:MAG: hypothetical protein AB7R90_03075 [Reyranellaceae bacterium]